MKPERVQRLPTPGIRAHTVDVVLGFPSEQLFGQTRVRIAGGDVARTPINYLEGHGFIGGGFKGLD